MSIKTSILILKSNPMALQTAEIFLTSRGWTVFSTSSLPDLIRMVLLEKPEYLLLCANHPHKKIKLMPKILTQAVNVKILLYVDLASTLNLALMNEMENPNQILPPVSGPSIERAIIKFEKDDQSRLNDKNKFNQESLSNFSFNKGESQQDLEKRIIQYLGAEDEGPAVIRGPTTEGGKTNLGGIYTSASKNESFAEYEERKKQESKAKFAESIIVKGAQHALESAVVKNPIKPIIEKLEKSENCLCIVIDSQRFAGYMVAALGKNRRFDDEFVKNIQMKLYEFLKAQGEVLDEEKPLEIKIKAVQFEAWALEQAEFLKKSIHKGDEVAMAFFPTRKTSPDVEPSAREDMLQINIDNLEGDVQVLFDLYIYLPANKKYILYTPKGSTFLANQKDRLKGKGVTHMHMKKEELGTAKKYVVENYLNSKVNDFNQTQKAKDIKKSS